MGAGLSNQDGTDAGGHQGSTSTNVVERAGIKADEREIEQLSDLITAASMRFDPQYLRQNDATIMQATVAAVEKFVLLIKDTLSGRWDVSLEGHDRCYMMGVLVRVVTESVPDILTFSRAHVEAMLSIIAEAEIELLNVSAGGHGRHPVARGASNRSRAKLILQERSEKAVTAVKASLDSFARSFDSTSTTSNVDIIIRGALAPLDSSNVVSPVQSPMGASGRAGAAGLCVHKATFLEHVASLVLQCIDTATLVEDGAYLRLVPAVLGSTKGGNDVGDSHASGGSLSTRVSLHANRMVALSHQKHTAANKDQLRIQQQQQLGISPERARDCEEPASAFVPGGKTSASQVAAPNSGGGGYVQPQQESQYKALVIATPPELQEVLQARETQLGQVISEIHNYTCMPALHSTITNPAGSHVIEFDTVQEQPSSFLMHHHERSDLGITKAGRYVRISPAVMMLMVLTKTTNSIVEHYTETINLVREDFAPANPTIPSLSSSKRPGGDDEEEEGNNVGMEMSVEDQLAHSYKVSALELYKRKYGYGWRDLNSGILYDTVIPNNEPAATIAASGALVLQQNNTVSAAPAATAGVSVVVPL